MTLISTVVLAQTSSIETQKFGASLLVSGNLSQLEGDNLSGFNKIGFQGGMLINYDLNKKKGLYAGFLYSQKGSSTGTIKNSTITPQSISLHYLSMPIQYYLNEWWEKDQQDHILRVNMGPIISRLVQVQSTNSFFDNATEDFNKWDLALSIGLSYRLSKKLDLIVSYERSITKVYQIPNSNLNGLQSYLINIGLSYSL